MKPLLQAENVAKRWGDLLLFNSISFTLFEGDKVGLIARNGAGKSSLLNILSGKDSADGGLVTVSNDVRIGYFEQIPVLNPANSVIDEIFDSVNEKLAVVKDFELAVVLQDQEKITALSAMMDFYNAWDAEVEIKQILFRLKINNLNQKVSELSGGQQKRLALAKVLVGEPNLLILDEPTNHLDLDMVEWLEEYLAKTKATLLLVTHDRYFLDRVCNGIIEMENNQVYPYRGNYSYFLVKREERIQAQQTSVIKAKNLFKTELEWMRRMPKARTHKAKYRTEAFYEIQEKANQRYYDKNLELNIQSTRLGKKIAELRNVSFAYEDVRLLSDFSYTFSRFEKVGIVGNNGTGKTTFLNLLTGKAKPDMGTIETGTTVKFGYYRQEGIQFNQGDKVIDAVKKIAEEIDPEGTGKISATQLLNQFLFSPETQYNYIGKLSGGEQRRLYLCTVLMQNPNFLILDEPTNDLDIMSLNVLEEYLRAFEGCVIVVSHDRFFMDKIVDHVFVFKGDGEITDFPGNYTQYRNYEEERVLQSKEPVKLQPEKTKPQKSREEGKKKMSFSERREFDNLGTEIAALEKKKNDLEEQLNSGTLNHEELFKKSSEMTQISHVLNEKELRWLELSELE
jgi:ABC transport system ATP-binding/permease protein